MKIVLAYSGGLDTSVILRWLKDNYDAEIIAFCADIGQEEELDGSGREGAAHRRGEMLSSTICGRNSRAISFSRCFRRARFTKANIFSGPASPVRSSPSAWSKSREQEKADAIAHGATGKGNDQVRFELTAAALAPELKVIAPWREERFRKQFPGRAEMIAFAKENKIPVEATSEKPYSMDRNLLHISYESGVLEDPWFDASSTEMRDMYKLSVAPEDAPNEAGICRTRVRSRQLRRSERQDRLSPLGVMQTLNKLGGKHGIGRVDIVENRFVGMKGRGVYETPGGAILHFAHRQMETLTMDREVMHLRDSLIPKYSTLVYNGFWFAPEREALQALVTETQRDVTGVVRLKLYKGNIIVAGRKSPKSLYDPQIATMEG